MIRQGVLAKSNKLKERKAKLVGVCSDLEERKRANVANAAALKSELSEYRSLQPASRL